MKKERKSQVPRRNDKNKQIRRRVKACHSSISLHLSRLSTCVPKMRKSSVRLMHVMSEESYIR